MSYWEPHPAFDFLTGNNEKNCMPWQPRRDENLSRHEWSEPHPLIIEASSGAELEHLAADLCASPAHLVVAIGEAHLALGDPAYTNTDRWYQTIIVQAKLPGRRG
jgi:hypothetical protein